MSKISIIIPCYYNEDNIPVTGKELLKSESIFPAGTVFEYIFVDDGSKDKTYERLLEFHSANPAKVKVIKLAGNVGAHNAALAGLHYATGDCVCFLAADLQDPPELLPKMFAYWQKGIKLVIANRGARQDPFMQRMISGFFHKMMRRFALKNVPENGYDVLLFDKQLQKELISIGEKNTNLSYLLTWMEFDYVNITYERRKREIGKSRWTLAKRIKLFIDSFVAFSFFPIRVISVSGLVLGVLSFAFAIYIIIAKLMGLIEVKGWAMMTALILFLASFQMLALGILGEYIWRTLDAVRNRPNFIVDEVRDIEPQKEL